MAIVATAEVRILADTSRFTPDLRRKLEQAFRTLDVDADGILGAREGEQQGKEFAQGVQRGLRSSRRVVVTEGRETGRRFAVGLTDEVRTRLRSQLSDSVFSSIISEARRSGVDTARVFSDGFMSGAIDDMLSEVEDRLRLLPLAIDENEFSRRLTAISNEVARAQQQSYRRIIKEFSAGGPGALKVEIDADTSPLERRLRESLARTVEPQGRISGRQFIGGFLRGLTTGIGGLLRGFGSLLTGIVGSVLQGEFSGTRIFSGLRSGFDTFRRSLGQVTNLVRSFVSGSGNMQEALDNIGKSGQNAGQGLNSAAQGAGRFGGAAGAIGSVVSTLAQFMFSIGTASTLIYAIQGAIGALIYIVQVAAGAFFLLGSAVQQVVVGGLLLLPGLIASAAGAMILLNRAFEDFGPATGAVDRLKSGFEELLDAASSTVWQGLSDDIDDLASSVLPAFERGLDAASRGLNSFLGSVIDALSSNEVSAAIEEIGAGLGTIFESLGPSVASLVGAFATLASAAVPVLTQLADAAGRLFENFASWVSSAEESGELAEFFDNMYTTMSLIASSIGNIVEGFFTLFGFAVEGSQEFLTNIEGATASFAEWAASDEGRAFVEFLVERAQAFFAALHDTFLEFADWAASEEGQVLMESLIGFGERLWNTIKEMVSDFTEWAASEEGQEMMEAIADAAESFLGILQDVVGVFSTIFGWAVDVYNTIVDIVGAFGEAIDAIGIFLDSTDQLRTVQRGGPTLQPGQQRPTPNAYGSIVRRPTYIVAGERYLPEVIMPLSNEQRVVSLAQQSGVDKILERNGAIGSQQPNITMHVASNSVSPTVVAHRAVDLIMQALVIR